MIGFDYKKIVLLALVAVLPFLQNACTPEENTSGFSDSSSVAQTLSQRAMNIITQRCQSCHGSASLGYGNINYIASHEALIGNQLVIPFSAAQSPLFQVINDSSMPISAPLAESEQAIIQEWIDSGAVAPGADDNSRGLEQFRFNQETLQAIYNDLQNLKQQNVNILNYRYFTMAHANNGVTAGEILAQFKPSLAKMLNSVSWSALLLNPVLVNNSQLVVRVNISELGWSPNAWSLLEKRYPFDFSVAKGVVRAPANLDPLREDFDEQNLLGLIKTEIRSSVPIMRIDWFVHEAAKPATYHELLQLPTNVVELETQLGLNVQAAINAATPLRAGFLDSGVSAYNRMIERHLTPYGSYWKSYDFQSNSGTSNIFQRPMGPIFTTSKYPLERQFAHAGGEIIFNLPNGLQAYVLTDNRDVRIDVAPTAIVQDIGRADLTVNNGISCIACHSRGMNRHDDEIRTYVSNNFGSFDVLTRAVALQMYVTNDTLKTAYDTDDGKFLSALLKIGIDGTATEPVGPVFYRYEQNLDLDLAAGELNVTAMRLQAAIQESEQLRAILGALLQQNGTINRTIFEQNYSVLYELLF